MTGNRPNEDCDIDDSEVNLQNKLRGMVKQTSGNRSNNSKTSNLKSSNIFFDDDDLDNTEGPAQFKS